LSGVHFTKALEAANFNLLVACEFTGEKFILVIIIACIKVLLFSLYLCVSEPAIAVVEASNVHIVNASAVDFPDIFLYFFVESKNIYSAGFSPLRVLEFSGDDPVPFATRRTAK